jgi:hypothetical protein
MYVGNLLQVGEFLMTRFKQLDLLLETWSADELLNELVRFLPNATFDDFFDDIAPGEDDGEDYDDSMDGDHQSALASCGWGTDEDYGGGDSGYDAW